MVSGVQSGSSGFDTSTSFGGQTGQPVQSDSKVSKKTGGLGGTKSIPQDLFGVLTMGEKPPPLAPDEAALLPPPTAGLSSGAPPRSDFDPHKFQDAGTSFVVSRRNQAGGGAPVPPATTEPGAVGPVSTGNATYSLGPATRPEIAFDNGGLQNPNDPSDPNPIATVPAEPGDFLLLAKWRVTLEGAERVQGIPGVPHNDLPDALPAYRHYLDGGGSDREFSYERFVSGDPSGATILKSATLDTQLAAQRMYAQMLAQDPSLANKTVTFDITGSPITAGASSAFPYPETENWQKAIGGHTIWNSATVTVTPPSEPGGRPTFAMDLTLHAEDRYNFDPGKADIATGVPDAENARLQQVGLAQQYQQSATLQRHVTWTENNGASTVSTPLNGR